VHVFTLGESFEEIIAHLTSVEAADNLWS
jgi:hypothetical protein